MKKQRKPTAKSRILQSDWEEMLSRHAQHPKFGRGRPTLKRNAQIVCEPVVTRIAAFVPHGGTAKPSPKYTGTAMLGIGTMHKSNAVPVFSQDDAIDIATMRRS